VREIIAQCRNADNVPYSPEEIEDMVNDLNDNKHTLNLPFCFTKGAMELKNSILNDVFQGIGANQCRHGGGDGYRGGCLHIT
jgi:hypothetical protein